jgi:threonine/homoserine/homoserine lactone efflux protein
MPTQPELLLPFLLASVLVTVVPGADMALVTRQVLVGGPRLAYRTIAGNLTGLLVHGFALAVGLSALIVASATAYTIVKLAGAAYLIWLGVQTIRTTKRPPEPAVESPAPRRAYLQGLLSTVLNPKPALFFLTFLPQFVDRARAVLTAPRVEAWLERTTGALLIALGVRVAVERR